MIHSVNSSKYILLEVFQGPNRWNNFSSMSFHLIIMRENDKITHTNKKDCNITYMHIFKFKNKFWRVKYKSHFPNFPVLVKQGDWGLEDVLFNALLIYNLMFVCCIRDRHCKYLWAPVNNKVKAHIQYHSNSISYKLGMAQEIL